MRAVCAECGGRIVVNGNKKNNKKTKGPKDKNHDLCQRCWKSERDRGRVHLSSPQAHRARET